MEETLARIYGNGLWQIILAFLCNTLNFIEMYDFQSNVFMLYKPDYIQCRTDQNVTWIDPSSLELALRNQTDNFTLISPKEAQCYGLLPEVGNSVYKCSEWIYPNDTINSNILIEHNLICDRKYISSWLQTNYWAGTILGLFICMSTDYFGRRSIVLVLTVLRLVTNFAMTMVNEIWLLFILLFLRSCCFPSSNVSITQVVELVPVKKRALYNHFCFIGWALGYITCPLIGYWLRDWRYVKYASLVLCIMHPMMFYFFVESPRWLLLRTREKEALYIFKRIGRFNNRGKSVDINKNLEARFLTIKDNGVKTEAKESIWKVLTTKQFMLCLTVMSLCRVSINSSYFGILYLSKFLSDNLYINIIFQGLVEMPSAFFTYFVCDRFGRTISCFVMLTTSSACLLTMIFIQNFKWAKIVVGMLAKLAITSSSNISIAYTTELFPTSLRNSAFFITSVCSAIASCFTPFVNAYFPTYAVLITYALPMMIFGGVTWFFLPETKGMPLPETVADMKGFVRGREHEWSMEKKKSLLPQKGEEYEVKDEA